MGYFKMLKYENFKEYYGEYVRNMVLIFSDNQITIENKVNVQEILNHYNKLDYEVIEKDVSFDKEKNRYNIILVIICSRWLLKDVTDKSYHDFINKHREKFMKFYEKNVIPQL